MASTETDIYKKDILIFGCGNILFGNDGFGPEVVNHLNENYAIPENTMALDAGTGIRDFIFDLLLMEKKPKNIFIIDAVTFDDRRQGEIFEIDLPNVPKEKMADFALHQSPSSNLLSQLSSQGVDVRVLGMHTAAIPNEIDPGLCENAQKAIPAASTWIINEINNLETSKDDSTDAKKRVL